MNWRKKLEAVTKGPKILKDWMNCPQCKHDREEMRNCYIARGGKATANAGGSPMAIVYYFKDLKCEHCRELYEKQIAHAKAGHPIEQK